MKPLSIRLFLFFCMPSCSSIVEACRPSPLTNRPSRQPPDTETSRGFPEKPSIPPYQDVQAVLSISASHRWHSQILQHPFFFHLKQTTILKVKGILPLLKGICGSTATTFKKTHVVIWTSPFLKAGLFASTLLLSKVFHVCMRLTSCETLFKSMLYVLASVNELNLQLKVLALSSPKHYTCLCFPGQLTTFLI